MLMKNINVNLSNFGYKFIHVTVSIILFYFSLAAFLYNAFFHNDSMMYEQEIVLFSNDNLLLNLIMLIVFILMAFFLYRVFHRFVNEKWTIIILLTINFIIGLTWIMMVRALPFFDGADIAKDAVARLMNTGNNFAYMERYPHQIGYSYVLQLFMFLFGKENYLAVQVVNLICIELSYYLLIKISGNLFKTNEVELITCILLCSFLPMLLFSTFIYGNILSYFFSVASIYSYLYFEKKSKIKNIFSLIVFSIMAMISKTNAIIVIIAITICLLLDFLKGNSIKSVFIAMMLIVSISLVQPMIISVYENEAGRKFESEPQIYAHLAMGLQESTRAPGWYNGYVYNIYDECNKCKACIVKASSESIVDRIDFFSSNLKYTFYFFNQKLISTWNEPSFQSIWVSYNHPHMIEINGFVQSVYNGFFSKLINSYFEYYLQFIYIFVFAGIISLDKCKREKGCILLLTILGAFLYFFFFETKSQYVITYIPMMIPFAAFSYCLLINQYKSVKNRRK